MKKPCFSTNISTEHLPFKNPTVITGTLIRFYHQTQKKFLHSKLFERLQGVLEKEEVDFLKALYSRNIIKLGKHSFKPKIGVAQGSIISPALFDIYSEDLLKKIEEKGVNREDILA